MFGTQAAAAAAAGVTQPRVSQWEEVIPELPARRLHDKFPELPLHPEHYERDNAA